MEYSVAIAFTIGVASVLHCLGMCGSISGALALSLPAPVRARRARLLPYVLAYNLGRLSSYAAAGALVGALGAGLAAGGDSYLRCAVQLLAAGVLAGIGLYLAGWFPAFAHLERVGEPWWRRLEPIGRRLIPVRSPVHAALFGSVWGWLPCGLVYSTLLWTLSAGSATQGALLMLAFGAGTLPGMVSVGVLTGWAARIATLPHLRKVIGVSILAMALVTLWYSTRVPDALATA